jgi:hypothetical protein
MRVFYPDIYIKTSAELSPFPATQELLKAALDLGFTNLPYCETGAKIEEQDGGSVVLANGAKVVYGKKVVGEIKNLEVTTAKYATMRLFNGVVCSIVFNESFASVGVIAPSGRAAQIQNVVAKVKLEGKAGDLFRITISFEKEGSLANVIEDYDLT